MALHIEKFFLVASQEQAVGACIAKNDIIAELLARADSHDHTRSHGAASASVKLRSEAVAEELRRVAQFFNNIDVRIK